MYFNCNKFKHKNEPILRLLINPVQKSINNVECDYIVFFSMERKDYGMKCPFCGFIEDKVIDSRPTDEGSAIRRRRECTKCTRRFTTYEKVESLPLMVIKKDKTRQPFDREKLMNGLLRACEKRPVSINDLEKLVDGIEVQLYNSLQREVTTEEIGELIMQKLKSLDEVAYVRFASVYRQFKDINTFMDEVRKLLKEGKKED